MKKSMIFTNSKKEKVILEVLSELAQKNIESIIIDGQKFNLEKNSFSGNYNMHYFSILKIGFDFKTMLLLKSQMHCKKLQVVYEKAGYSEFADKSNIDDCFDIAFPLHFGVDESLRLRITDSLSDEEEVIVEDNPIVLEVFFGKLLTPAKLGIEFFDWNFFKRLENYISRSIFLDYCNKKNV